MQVELSQDARPRTRARVNQPQDEQTSRGRAAPPAKRGRRRQDVTASEGVLCCLTCLFGLDCESFRQT